MTYWQAILLGLVQGLTEFLPVSSSGHLAIIQKLLGLDPASPEMLSFDVCAHVGTLVAVASVFAPSMLSFLRGLVRQRSDLSGPGTLRRRAPGWHVLLLAVVACVPTGAIGLGFKDQLQAAFDKPIAIGCCLIATGFLLMATRFVPTPRRGWRRFGLLAALLVGVAQGLAILPGVSRSGATICTALYCGLKRRWAAEFSFLIAFPAILGATLLEARHAFDGVAVPWGRVVVGSLVAAVSGYFALRTLVAMVRRARLHLFAYYCWPLGAAVLLAALSGRL